MQSPVFPPVLFKSCSKIKTKQQPKRRKKEKLGETKIKIIGIGMIWTDATWCRCRLCEITHCARLSTAPCHHGCQWESYFMLVNIASYISILRMDLFYCGTQLISLEYSISASLRVIVAFNALLNILFSVLWQSGTQIRRNDGLSIQMVSKIIFVESCHPAFSLLEFKFNLLIDFRLNS